MYRTTRPFEAEIVQHLTRLILFEPQTISFLIVCLSTWRKSPAIIRSRRFILDERGVCHPNFQYSSPPKYFPQEELEFQTIDDAIYFMRVLVWGTNGIWQSGVEKLAIHVDKRGLTWSSVGKCVDLVKDFGSLKSIRFLVPPKEDWRRFAETWVFEVKSLMKSEHSNTIKELGLPEKSPNFELWDAVKVFEWDFAEKEPAWRRLLRVDRDRGLL